MLLILSESRLVECHKKCRGFRFKDSPRLSHFTSEARLVYLLHLR